MFKVSDLDPDDLSNYSIDEIYSDIENLMEDEQIVAHYLSQVKEGKDIKWGEIESNINLNRYDKVIISLMNDWGVRGLKIIRDTTYTIISASLKSAQEGEPAEGQEQGADKKQGANRKQETDKKQDVEYIIKQFDEYLRRVHEQNMHVLRSYLPPVRQGWWTETSVYAQFISDIGKMYHDLATAMTYVLYEIRDSVKLNPYKDIIDELEGVFNEVKIYPSGTTINIQANTGHTVKIITSELKIVGHLGDHAPIPDVDIKYKRTINRNKGRLKELIKTVASIVEQEQIIRTYLNDIDYLLNQLYNEADTEDSEIVMEMIRSGDNWDMQEYYEKMREDIETIKIAWDTMMEYVIELQKYLAEPTEIKHEYWFGTLPTSSFSHLFKELQLLNLF